MNNTQTLMLAAGIVAFSSIQVALADTNQSKPATQLASQPPIPLKVEKQHRSVGSKLKTLVTGVVMFPHSDDEFAAWIRLQSRLRLYSIESGSFPARSAFSAVKSPEYLAVGALFGTYPEPGEP